MFSVYLRNVLCLFMIVYTTHRQRIHGYTAGVRRRRALLHGNGTQRRLSVLAAAGEPAGPTKGSTGHVHP